MYKELNLCMPDAEKSCFACCPPIRPSGYEHIQYENIIKRLLRENTCSFRLRKHHITGFSCWALGFIDKDFRQVGCLLHPEKNDGRDLRDLTGYGEKCRREYCLEARIFSHLGHDTENFWIQFANGLNSFSYSSRKFNPLFRLLRWGEEVLEHIAKRENYCTMSLSLLEERYPFLKAGMDPRGIAYPVKLLFRSGKMIESGFIEQLIKGLKKKYTIYVHEESQRSFNAPYVHRLDMDRDFLDFLRLGLSIKRMDYDMALLIKEGIDRLLPKSLFAL